MARTSFVKAIFVSHQRVCVCCWHRDFSADGFKLAKKKCLGLRLALQKAQPRFPDPKRRHIDTRNIVHGPRRRKTRLLNYNEDSEDEDGGWVVLLN
jgi:hypothetical protein